MRSDLEKESDSSKVVIIFAGPNGSGKSTVNSKYMQDARAEGFDGVYINADDISKGLESDIKEPFARNVEAANRAEQLRLECLKSGASFAFETVMSTPEKVALMTQAKERGYSVNLVFVTTDDADINVRRVQERVEKGGHPVIESSIKSRYESAMKLLPCAVEHADSVFVYDNSLDGKAPLLVAQKVIGSNLEVSQGVLLPEWVTDRLMDVQRSRIESLAFLGKALKDQGYAEAPPVKHAEAVHGASYSGRIVAASALHVLQEQAKSQMLVHDKSLMQSRTYVVGQNTTVTYAYDRGKIAEVERGRER